MEVSIKQTIFYWCVLELDSYNKAQKQQHLPKSYYQIYQILYQFNNVGFPGPRLCLPSVLLTAVPPTQLQDS